MSKEEFDSYISNGIIVWGPPVTDVLEEGDLRVRQTVKSEMTPLVSILIEGKNQNKSKFSRRKSSTSKNVVQVHRTAVKRHWPHTLRSNQNFPI